MTDACTCPYCGSAYVPPPIRVDLNRNVISIDGIDVKVQALAAELMTVMLEEYPGLASFDRLVARMWGATGGPENVNSVLKAIVWQARQALNGTKWAIVNIRGRGYCVMQTEEARFE